MTRPRPTGRIVGWLLAGAAALELVGGAAAFALAAKRRETVLILDLGATPPSAPAIAAVSEATPEVASTDPSLPAPPDPADAAPAVPDATTQPMLAAAAPLTLPVIDPPVAADLILPPEKAEPEAYAKPTTRPKARPDARKETKRKDPSPREPARSEKPASSASAPRSAATATGGDVSPAAYARAVMRKVRATKRKSGAGKGTVVVGFTIAADGSLASVQVLQGSGDAALDASAMDHIRRSAPFPPPGANAGQGYAFEFVGK